MREISKFVVDRSGCGCCFNRSALKKILAETLYLERLMILNSYVISFIGLLNFDACIFGDVFLIFFLLEKKNRDQKFNYVCMNYNLKKMK